MIYWKYCDITVKISVQVNNKTLTQYFQHITDIFELQCIYPLKMVLCRYILVLNCIKRGEQFQPIRSAKNIMQVKRWWHLFNKGQCWMAWIFQFERFLIITVQDGPCWCTIVWITESWTALAQTESSSKEFEVWPLYNSCLQICRIIPIQSCRK